MDENVLIEAEYLKKFPKKKLPGMIQGAMR